MDGVIMRGWVLKLEYMMKIFKYLFNKLFLRVWLELGLKFYRGIYGENYSVVNFFI